MGHRSRLLQPNLNVREGGLALFEIVPVFIRELGFAQYTDEVDDRIIGPPFMVRPAYPLIVQENTQSIMNRCSFHIFLQLLYSWSNTFKLRLRPGRARLDSDLPFDNEFRKS